MGIDRVFHSVRRKFNGNSRPSALVLGRVAICVVGYAIVFQLLASGRTGSESFFGRSDPGIHVFSALIFVLGSMALLTVFWFVSGAIPRIAKSLGYSEGPDRQIVPRRNSSFVTLPLDASPAELTEKYDSTDLLSPLESARQRITDHVVKLRNNSVANLFIGVGIALAGLAVLISMSFQIGRFYEIDANKVSLNHILFVLVIPNFVIALVAQLFSYFFIWMYRGNQYDIKYFMNEITLLDSLATAVMAAQRPGSSPNMKLVLTALSRNERNRVMKKDEKSILVPDVTELMHHAATAASRTTNRAEKAKVEQE